MTFRVLQSTVLEDHGNTRPDLEFSAISGGCIFLAETPFITQPVLLNGGVLGRCFSNGRPCCDRDTVERKLQSKEEKSKVLLKPNHSLDTPVLSSSPHPRCPSFSKQGQVWTFQGNCGGEKRVGCSEPNSVDAAQFFVKCVISSF